MQKVLEVVGGLVLTVLFAGLMAVMFIEWMAGCGESYIDANGVRHLNECIIINHGKK